MLKNPGYQMDVLELAEKVIEYILPIKWVGVRLHPLFRRRLLEYMD
jgi:hypothetical protein